MDNPAMEVLPRKRSPPYQFYVTIGHQGRAITAYKGASAISAHSAYWQAVNTLLFLRTPGQIELAVALSKKPYGSFLTEVEPSGPKSLHVPNGGCVQWLSGSWSGDNRREKMLATIPGTPGSSFRG